MKTYRVAIVGLGRMGSTIDEEIASDVGITKLPYSIAGSCKSSDRLELVAGADLLPERREAFREKWGVEALYEGYLEMVEKEKPDLVAVCTTATGLQKPGRTAPSRDFREDMHAEMAVRLAEAGVPMLFVEKAMACSMAAADKVLEACRKHSTVFNTGVIRRFDSRYRAVRDAIARGDIGKPAAAVHYASVTLMHNHIHSIDTLSYLLGDPGVSAVRGELRPRDLKVEDNRLDEDPQATYEISFANGAEAWTVPAGAWDFEIIGDGGAIRVMNNGIHLSLRKAGPVNRLWPQSTFQDTPWAPTPEWEGVSTVPTRSKSAVVSCLEDLVEAYENGRPSLGNVEVTHRITEACLGIAESHRRGGPWVEPSDVDRDLYVFHV